MKTLTRKFLLPLAMFALLPLMQAVAQDKAPSLAEVIFYPPLPDDPRLQFLTRLSSQKDLGEEKKGFSNFIMGDVEKGDLVNKPYGVAVYEGAVFVTDIRGGGYGVFDMASGSTRFVQPTGAAELKKPTNIFIDSDGTRYIADAMRQQILVFDRNDKFIRIFGKRGQFKPNDMLIVGERLYVSDIEHHQIHVLNKLSGEVELSFGEQGSEEGQFVHPASMALGPDQTLWVVDTTNFRLQQFSLDGEFLSTVGSIGTSPGHFGRPKGLAIDQEGSMYIGDAAFEHVQVMETSGQPLLIFGNPGYAPHSVNLPTVVKIDYDNVKYFQQYAYPGFEIEYLILVAGQFGPNKVVVYGFGSLDE